MDGDKTIEKIRNYDMVCWYVLNAIPQSPQIISYDKEITDEFLNTLLILTKNSIKDKYGIS